MNPEIRARCLRSAYWWFAISLAPLAVVGWLVWQGKVLAAVLVFCGALTTITVGTLVPRCALFGRMTKRLPEESGQLLLTIDDGPHPEHTPAILDLLDQHCIKAVFFLIGERAARHPELVREIIARGHEVGNHTQTHPATRFWSLPPQAMWREIAECQKTLTEICPENPPRLFRPPAGHHNMSCFVTARCLGLRMLMWSARGFDGVQTDVKAITDRIRPRVKSGAIVLIHECTPVAIEVAQAVIPMLAGSGLKCNAPPSALTFGDN